MLDPVLEAFGSVPEAREAVAREFDKIGRMKEGKIRPARARVGRKRERRRIEDQKALDATAFRAAGMRRLHELVLVLSFVYPPLP